MPWLRKCIFGCEYIFWKYKSSWESSGNVKATTVKSPKRGWHRLWLKSDLESGHCLRDIVVTCQCSNKSHITYSLGVILGFVLHQTRAAAAAAAADWTFSDSTIDWIERFASEQTWHLLSPTWNYFQWHTARLHITVWDRCKLVSISSVCYTDV